MEESSGAPLQSTSPARQSLGASGEGQGFSAHPLGGCWGNAPSLFAWRPFSFWGGRRGEAGGNLQSSRGGGEESLSATTRVCGLSEPVEPPGQAGWAERGPLTPAPDPGGRPQPRWPRGRG